jgi:hypothetical protein
MKADHIALAAVARQERPLVDPLRDGEEALIMRKLHEDLNLLGFVAAQRFSDPSDEDERVALISAALDAGRTASRAMQMWVSHSLTEYRGSHSRWDVAATTADLSRALDVFVCAVGNAATRLRHSSAVRLAGASGRVVSTTEATTRTPLVRGIESARRAMRTASSTLALPRADHATRPP